MLLLYFSAHVQRTKQALGNAPHEALFKKNKHTKKFTETLQRIVDRHTNLFFHIFLIAISTPPSLHAPFKIIANFPSSSAASNSPLSGCPRLFLSVLSYPAILHTLEGNALHPPLLAHCILYIFSLLYLPLSIFRL